MGQQFTGCRLWRISLHTWRVKVLAVVLLFFSIAFWAYSHVCLTWAVPWLRLFVAGPLTRSTGLDRGWVHVIFMVNGGLMRGFIRVLQVFFCQYRYTIVPYSYLLIYHRRYIILAFDSVVT